MANFIYVRQKGEPKGNALPLYNAAHLLDPDEPFYMFFLSKMDESAEKRWQEQQDREMERRRLEQIEKDKCICYMCKRKDSPLTAF